MSKAIFLKPLLEDGESFKQQTKDIKNYFRPAFGLVDLKLPDHELEGVAVCTKEITPRLMERIFNANVIVVDANSYSDITALPWLYYCIGLGHSMQNHTVLVARSLDHLPASLRKQHSLSYDISQPAEFFDLFVPIVKSILSGENNEPDNPIQEYLYRQKLESQLQKLKIETQTKDAQIRELEQRGSADTKASAKITFRKVGS
jgi:hypothetical protein